MDGLVGKWMAKRNALKGKNLVFVFPLLNRIECNSLFYCG